MIIQSSDRQIHIFDLTYKEDIENLFAILKELPTLKERFKTAENFNPDNYNDIIIPNWLTKSDVEDYIGRKLDNDEWNELKEYITYYILPERIK